MTTRFEELDEPAETPPVELAAVWSGREFAKQVAYAVIVEAWRKKDFGRGKRAWLKEFTEAERRLIAAYHKKFYDWHLVSGTPERVVCRPATLQLLQRATNFFASI